MRVIVEAKIDPYIGYPWKLGSYARGLYSLAT